MRQECEAHGKRIAFLSTPSIFFSLKNKELKANSVLFDLDPQWTNLPNYVVWNFNEPLGYPEEMKGTFDYVVIDPPFITEEVWQLYIESTKSLLTPGGKVLGTTIVENKEQLDRELGCKPQVFAPSIPKLVYQYSLYVNYESELFSQKNPEIPDDY
eukprot:CAMPEP_0197866530 /NCGR_PEP_ID=MMETSP1438-20131217/44263_1 /TAXON_ID=1461541 /ORGANISM="Pterosperma sp., Strain CCMP1384" /LENGTH=155 /DNA_ID=CAMNT_0043485101 /DNA_START=436 /DNA_END=903 /DNA_ORIENTATION=+